MASGMSDGPGQELEAEAHGGGTDARHVGLALAADVEQAGMEGHRHGQAGEDEVGGVVEQVAPALERAHRALQHDPHGLERILADDEDDEARDQQRHGEVEQRDQPDIHPGRQFAPRAGHQAASFGDAGHEQAELALVRLGAALAHDAAGEHHQDAVGERADLVELDRDEQHGLALVAQLR